MSCYDTSAARDLKLLESMKLARLGSRRLAREAIARESKVQPGTLENIRRERSKGVRAYVVESIRCLLVKEINSEIKRLEHERLVVAQSLLRSDADQIAEIAADLGKVRSALKSIT